MLSSIRCVADGVGSVKCLVSGIAWCMSEMRGVIPLLLSLVTVGPAGFGVQGASTSFSK